MRDKILELIEKHPRHYTVMIKKNSEMMSWIDNSTSVQGTLVERVRSAVYNESNVCPNGNLKSVKRFNEGWVNCGPANVCKCTRDEISQSVSTAKSSLTPSQIESSNQKRSDTMLKKYGVEFNSKRDDVKQVLKKSKMNHDQYTHLSDDTWLRTQYVDLKRTSVDIAEELEVHNSTVLEYCRKHGFEIRQYSNYSMAEVKITDFLRRIGVECIERDRTVLSGLELDIYIPSKKIGIEVNGLLYHSYHPSILNHKNFPENRDRHVSKTTTANNQQITLLHFTDYQINNQWNIVQSIIKSKIGVQEKIGARKCIIREVYQDDSKKFFEKYHLQGHTTSKKTFGLYYNDELVQCLSIGKNRYRDNELEIIRFATILNKTVTGGLSKLINHVRITNPHDIITTYCDRDISTGQGYVNSGFKIIGYTKPGYFWTDGTRIISRYKAQRDQLCKWLPQFNTQLSESENMFNAGYRRFWNCGNIVLQYTK